MEELKDKFDLIFSKQKVIIEKLKEKFPERKMTYVDLIDAMSNECEELRDSFPWKKWKKNFNNHHDINIENARIEAIDILFFLVEFFVEILDMSSDDVYKLYVEKHKENLTRYKDGY